MEPIILQSNNMFKGMDIVQILQIAGAGLAFLLVIVAFYALKSNPERFKIFSLFAVIMMVLGIAPTISSQIIDNKVNSNEEISEELVKLQIAYDLINDEKNKISTEKDELQKKLTEIEVLWCRWPHVNCSQNFTLGPARNRSELKPYEIELCALFSCH